MIETPRLLLRPLALEDADALARLWADPEVTRYAGGPRPYRQSRQAIEKEAAAPSGPPWRWTVVERASGEIVGDCGLLRKEIEGAAELELIYFLFPKSWGKGYATEAAGAAIQVALQREVPRLVALIDPRNAGSARVAEKLAFRWERDIERDGHLKRLFTRVLKEA